MNTTKSHESNSKPNGSMGVAADNTTHLYINQEPHALVDDSTEPITKVETSIANMNIDDDYDSSKCEPFPDYYESCRDFDEGGGHMERMYREQEEAYNLAISKAIDEVIRFREVDTNITRLPSFADNLSSDLKDEENPECTEVEEHNIGPDSEALGEEIEIEAPTIIDDLSDLLSNPDLKPRIKERFTAMTNMVIYMNILLFHTPTVPGEFKLLIAKDDAIAAKRLAEEIFNYLAKLEQQVGELVCTAKSVAFILSVLAQDQSVSVFVTFRRMVQVVTSHLKKPRPLERRLLFLFLELYVTYVYNVFQEIGNQQIVIEDELNQEKLGLSRALINVWDILNRVIENYDSYVLAMKDMRGKYFTPTMESLAKSPEIWQDYPRTTKLGQQLQENSQPINAQTPVIDAKV
ncbi:hypothetical protein Egran_06468 [Elaphomyces granulatus]|uniref:Uncharacterized protein n=1 Tax=Elaphomyces granulatus TaxID=519963 RepID=A0A232LNM7_9EURO|nr:hypothetical protein Egran_06468 [Elaphomyces granulatus]